MRCRNKIGDPLLFFGIPVDNKAPDHLGHSKSPCHRSLRRYSGIPENHVERKTRRSGSSSAKFGGILDPLNTRRVQKFLEFYVC